MAQDVALWGVAYTDVPEVRVPKQGGGMAAFHDVSDTTAQAADVAQGKLFHAADGTLTTGTASGGGGGGGNMSDPIRFFDYDGTLVASYTAVPSELPAVPTHDKLTNGTWNYTLTEVQTQFSAMGTCDVGANYDTISGATEIDIELQEGRLHPYLSLAVNGTVSIDWGDGSTPSTSTGTSVSTRKTDIHHEYAAAGKYTIEITPTSSSVCALLCTKAYTLLNKNVSSNNPNYVYANCVKNVRMGVNCNLGNYAFYYCTSLGSVSITASASVGSYAFQYCSSLTFAALNNVSTLSTYAFASCSVLRAVSLPASVTVLSQYAFNYCYSLKSVSIPERVTSVGTYAFQYCTALDSIVLPRYVTAVSNYAFTGCKTLSSVIFLGSVKTFGTSAFDSCTSLASIVIPNSVTGISNSSFANCTGLARFRILATTPPTVTTNSFTNIPTDGIIYVPQGTLETYQSTSNWSNYASHMQEEPA